MARSATSAARLLGSFPLCAERGPTFAGLFSTAAAPPSSAAAASAAAQPGTAAPPTSMQAASAQPKKKSSIVEPLYFYAAPGTSVREPSYGVSISDADVYHYDPRSPSYLTSSTVINVSNPARSPSTSKASTVTFNRKPSNKEARYMISLSDPVFRTENDIKD